MILERPDLDGQRLVKKGSPDVWLVFHGRRHWVTGPDVYESLFSEAEHLTTIDDLDSIARGPDLIRGSMLIRSAEGHDIFLLTSAFEGGIRRHHVINYESFVEFGFDDSKVVSFPGIIVDGLRQSRDITSAHSPGRLP